MKALSIQQPWAWAIVWAGKNIENRSWRTHYRGDVAIHAPAALDREGRLPRGIRPPGDHDLLTSAVLGVATLVDVITTHRSRWFHGPFGFLLTNVRPLKRPIPCKGGQKLWELPTAIDDAVRRQIASSARIQPATPKDVAGWMVAQINAGEDVELNQRETAAEVAEIFGREFASPDPYGVLSIDRRVLRYFRLWTADSVVFVTHPENNYSEDAHWRKRIPGDAPGRRQTMFD